MSDASWYHHREAQNHSPEHSRSPFLAGDMIFPLEVNRYIGRLIYRADIRHFLIYRPISVFSSADLKSGMSAGSPVLLMRWNVLLPHVKDPKPKLLEDSTTVLGDKDKA